MNQDNYNQWFDTEFYHILYQNRDHTEAKIFMDNLCHKLSLVSNSRILDLACGKGRHSIYLQQMGYHVNGVDLSPRSIAYAKQFENQKLHFNVQDMRQLSIGTHDAVFNLFTSFGYFDNDQDDIRVLQSIENSLNTTGISVIDYMNTQQVIAELLPKEIKEIGGIKFHIKRYVSGQFIIKDISFEHQGKSYQYQEQVKNLPLEDFKKLISHTSLKLKATYGDYQLNAFDKQTSPRLILILSL